MSEYKKTRSRSSQHDRICNRWSFGDEPETNTTIIIAEKCNNALLLFNSWEVYL